MIDASLRSRERLRLSARFALVRRHGTWMRGQWLSLGALPNELTNNRVGIRVRRGVKRAVTRNRIKRVFKSVYQTNKSRLKSGFDLVVVLSNAGSPARQELQTDFLKVCQRLKLLSSP